MQYFSTRGDTTPLSFTDVLLEGLSKDGGLSIPASIPRVSTEQLEAWRGLSYAELAFEILRLYVTDIPESELKEILQRTYRADVFGSEQIVPIKPLTSTLSLLGLSEGPTLAFKDMAMQWLGNVFEYVLSKKNRQLTILGATSGDTGSAAEYAMRGKKGVSVFMLSPHGRMSDFQRAQMFSLQDANIHNIAVKGVFDDCQDMVKAVSADLAFKEKYHIGAVNSINWARIVAQVVYYFHGWLQATTKPTDLVSFAVPSGNFGNILAGHVARMMGLPIRRLVLATNENNVLEEFFRTGVYRPRGSAQTYQTSSPSMDISKASNFERFVYHLLGNDGQKVKRLWQQLEVDGYFDLSQELPRFTQEFGFVTGVSTHQNRLDTIKQVYQDTGVIIDPHTADGVKVANQYIEEGIPMLVLETALPAKFNETIVEAIQVSASRPERLNNIEQLPQKFDVMDIDVEALKTYIKENV